MLYLYAYRLYIIISINVFLCIFFINRFYFRYMYYRLSIMNNDITNTSDEIIFIIFVINDKFVRWEIFSPNATLRDIYTVLLNKYCIRYCTLHWNDVYLSTHNQIELYELCETDTATLYITTADKNYTLSKSII